MARNPLRVFPLIRQIRRERFDLVFDAANEATVSFNHLVLTARSGGRFRIGHQRTAPGDDVRSRRHYEIVAPATHEKRHVTEMHLDLLRAICDVPSVPLPTLDISQCQSAFGRRFRKEQHLDAHRPVVVIHPGARGAKQWNVDNFNQVARRTANRSGAQIVVIWGPDDNDQATTLRKLLGNGAIYAGILPFDDLIALFRESSAFVSGDCGPMHLATASGVPTMGVFVASDPVLYRPLGTFDRVFDVRSSAFHVEQIATAISELCESTIAERTSPRIT